MIINAKIKTLSSKYTRIIALIRPTNRPTNGGMGLSFTQPRITSSKIPTNDIVNNKALKTSE